MPDNDQEQTIPAHLFRIARAMRKLMPPPEEAADLTPLQMQTLFFIKQHGPCTLKEIADDLNISPASATLLADRLVNSGYAQRIPSEEDRRKVILALTEETKEKMTHQMAQMRKRGELMTQDLTPEEVTEMKRILTKMETTLTNLITHS